MQGWASLILRHSLVKTGVCEQMAAGPRTLDELAAACQLDGPTLTRVLRMTTALEITAREGHRYSLTGLGRAMLKETPGSLYTNLVLVGAGCCRLPLSANAAAPGSGRLPRNRESELRSAKRSAHRGGLSLHQEQGDLLRAHVHETRGVEYLGEQRKQAAHEEVGGAELVLRDVGDGITPVTILSVVRQISYKH